MDYVFDGSFNGYLCCVFEAFERKEFYVTPKVLDMIEPNIFNQQRQVMTVPEKSSRILKGIEKIIGKKDLNIFYHNFLADQKGAWEIGFRTIIRLFKYGKIDIRDYGNPEILQIHKTIKQVSRERHRMKAFVRFVKSSDGLYTALIEPDLNVLPLIIPFFKNRFSDQDWLINDIRRNYGYHYDGREIHEVLTSENQEIENPYALELDLDSRETEFQHLWKTYFKSTNIEERKNIKLHLRHVPKRYWKYLVEKQ